MSERKQLKVTRVVTEMNDEQTEINKILLYGEPTSQGYFVIAPNGSKIEVGDKIEYKTYSDKFGFFKKKVK